MFIVPELFPFLPLASSLNFAGSAENAVAPLALIVGNSRMQIKKISFCLRNHQ